MSAHKPNVLPSAPAGSETSHPATLLDGTPYRFIAPLGRGGMGDVVEAEHVALGKRVVVKLLQERHANRADYIDRMRIEFRCFQWTLRILWRDCGGVKFGSSPLSHF